MLPLNGRDPSMQTICKHEQRALALESANNSSKGQIFANIFSVSPMSMSLFSLYWIKNATAVRNGNCAIIQTFLTCNWGITFPPGYFFFWVFGWFSRWHMYLWFLICQSMRCRAFVFLDSFRASGRHMKHAWAFALRLEWPLQGIVCLASYFNYFIINQILVPCQHGNYVYGVAWQRSKYYIDGLFFLLCMSWMCLIALNQTAITLVCYIFE